MNAAVLRSPSPADARRLRPVLPSMLDALLAIEQAAYEFPWSRGNFIDSLAAGYAAEALFDEARGEMLAYFVAMPALDEMHLLNLTVAPAWQRQGIASALLDELVQRCRARGLRQLWLEVRGSNVPACALYRRHGFRVIGVRKGYYPAAGGTREDAQVMSLKVGDALV